MADNATSALFTQSMRPDSFTADRIRWVINLRWFAMTSLLVALAFSISGKYPGVAWPMLVLVFGIGTTYNFFLWRTNAAVHGGVAAAVGQALVDMLLLTMVLWAAGGIDSPFIGYYIFHVALIAILGGPRATLLAIVAAFAGAGFLAVTEAFPALKIGTWNPVAPWDVFADVIAFVTTLGAAAYVVTHAVNELRDRERQLKLVREEAEAAERRLLLAERLASLGRIAQGVAHELNTPLATIRTLATDMREALRAESHDRVVLTDINESAELIYEETGRLGRITHALLAGGDLQTPRAEPTPLAPLTERARALVFAGVRDGPRLVVDESLHRLEVYGDRDRLVQVLMNLVQNALDAIRESGGSEIKVSARTSARGVEVLVEDDGPGISEEIESRLFEPFATTKPPGEGTGLGLYASYMLVQAMGGDLFLENRAERGARAVLTLPAVKPLADDSGMEQRAHP